MNLHLKSSPTSKRSRHFVSARVLLVLALVSGASRTDGAEGDAASFPQVGNFTQSFVWGKMDDNVPPVLGNGDIGGLFDPFGGTTYDELRFGSGAKRDIRTLF